MIAPVSSTTTRNRRCSEKKVRRCRPESASTPRSARLVILPARISSCSRAGRQAEPFGDDGGVDLHGAIFELDRFHELHLCFVAAVMRAPGSSGRRGIGAFRQRRGVEFAHEGFAGGGEFCFQPAARLQHAIAAILAKTFDQRRPFQGAHHFADRDRLGGAGQREAAADAALGRDEAAIGEVAHHLGQMVAGNAELGRDLVGRERTAGLARQPHQGAQGKIRERCQAHGSPFEISACKSSIAV